LSATEGASKTANWDHHQRSHSRGGVDHPINDCGGALCKQLAQHVGIVEHLDEIAVKRTPKSSLQPSARRVVRIPLKWAGYSGLKWATAPT